MAHSHWQPPGVFAMFQTAAGGTLEAGPHDGRWIVTAELPRPGTMAR